MKTTSKVYVAGHRGLAGSAILRGLGAAGFRNIVTRTHAELDLTDQHAVRDFFRNENPEYVFLAAGKVGGIMANDLYRAEFIRENLAIQSNVIHEAYCAGVRQLLSLGSSCIYPRDCSQPIREEYLMTGPLEQTNQPYAIAKIAGIEMCWSYNRQYGTRYICAMPTNLYGPGDSYDLKTSHVLPALIRRFHAAARGGDPIISLWGSGTPRREFLFSDDMAEACIFLACLTEDELAPIFQECRAPIINVGCGEDISIRELAHLIRDITGASSEIRWDRSKPDGTPRKLLDISMLKSLGWSAKTGLAQGIERAYGDFLNRVNSAELS